MPSRMRRSGAADTDRLAGFIRPTAHRGLHSGATGWLENSQPAFLAAVEHGYGIECDIQPAAGGLPIVFHDDRTERLIDRVGPVATLTRQDLATLKLRGSDAGILTFDEFLHVVGGQVPILAEIKTDWQPPNTTFLEAMAECAKRYRGALAFMSYDPVIMEAMAELVPTMLRGLVARQPDDAMVQTLGDRRAYDVANLLSSSEAKPDFIAYRVQDLPTPVTRYVREVQGLPVFAWTVRSPADWETANAWADAAIFEGPVPPYSG